MAEVKQPRAQAEREETVDRARDFWTRNSRPIIYALAGIVLLVGGFFAYKNFVKEPNERKAVEAMFKAEEYFRMDSLQLALNGDGQFAGFEKVISQYGGTKAGNLARFYAGAIYVKLGEFPKAIKHLKEFDSDAPQINARAYKLLADAYADGGNNSEALSNYKKAARTFEDDPSQSSEYLYLAAYFADRVVNNKKEAIELYKELKKKFPQSNFATEADRYLAQAGVYSTED
jgi:predicted negative regulator of RcsB-dependent stress response